MQSILVVQLYRHGAVLQSTPALSALRKSFPGARIHALVCKPFGESLRGNPDVDEIIEWDVAGALAPPDSLDMESADTEATVGPLSALKDSLRPFQERRFDAVYNLSNNALSALVACLLRPRHAAGMVFCRDRSYRVRNDWLRHLFAGSNVRSLNVFNRVDVLIHACGGNSSARRPLVVAVTAEDERYAEEALGGRQARAPIGIQPGAHKDGRRWPAGHFAQLASGLLRGGPAQSGHDLIFFGSADERAEIERIARRAAPDGKGWLNLAGRTSFGQLAALLKRCRLLVSNDTATAHVAAAAGVPCLVLAFGASNGSETGPYGEGHFVLEPRMPCFPCQCGQLCSSLACRERLTPDLVLAAVECALSDGRDVPGPLRDAEVVLSRSRWMPDGLWGLYPLTAPMLRLKDLLRFMMRSCFRHQRLADPETRGAGGEWHPWLEDIFAWYSLGDREALLGECAAAAEEFATLQRSARMGIETASAAVMQATAQNGEPAHRTARSAPRFEQRILALEENETLRPLVAAFRHSLPDIESLPPRQRAVARRWNCHTLAEESAFMAQALLDFERGCARHCRQRSAVAVVQAFSR
ncbi:MAG: glycosyltransferase family 9 protein [Candidatus Brocadiia bacterium]